MSKNNNIEEKLNQLGRTIAPGPSITDAVMHRIRRESPAPAPGRFIMLKKQIKWLTAAAAIVIVVFVFTFTSNTGKQGLAWAQIAQQVQQARSYSYQMDMTMNGVMAEGQPPINNLKMNMSYLFSADYGMKIKSFKENKLAMEMYINPGDNTAVMLMPIEKKFMQMEFNEETVQKMKQQTQDIRDIFKQLLNCEYSEIGFDTINGVKVKGIESSDPKLMGGMMETCTTRIWSDVRDGWPVQIEFSGSANNGQMEMSYIIHDYQWNIDIDPAEFEYAIPDDYTEMPKMQMPAMNAETAVNGLKKFVELLGQYPKTLNMMKMMQELKDLKKPEGSTSKDKSEKIKEMMQQMMPIQYLGMFYAQLIQQDKDPAYYGQFVTPEDADLPLLRWKSADEEYTVIFGDLHTETVTPDQLTRLESALPR